MSRQLKNGCVSTIESIAVTINALDVATFSYDQTTYNLSDINPTPTITGLQGGTYTSSPNGLIIDSLTGEIDLLNSNPDDYVITYKVTGNCNEVTAIQNITITGTVLEVGTEEFIVFKLYPNPTNDLVTIESNQEITKVVIYNMIGQKVKTVPLGMDKKVDLSDLQRATYLLSLYKENIRLGTKPVIRK